MQKRKVKTMVLSGNDYAKVNERIKAIRSDCPNALIETTPTFGEGFLMFKARILKDKADPHSAEAIGHSYKTVKESEKEKFFEKQETISIGRALAFLGYAPDGEIASSEEMEEFLEYQEEQKETQLQEYKERIEECASLDDLKKVWATIPAEGGFQKALAELKESMKNKLNEKNTDAPKLGRVAKVAQRKDNGVTTERHPGTEGDGAQGGIL
jgi:hypothetical protein